MSEIDPLYLAKDYSKFVTFTARMMAAMRARETSREDQLFNDPFAAKLAGEEAFQRVDLQLTSQDGSSGLSMLDSSKMTLKVLLCKAFSEKSNL